MNLTDKVQVIGVSALIALAISGGLYQLVVKPAILKPLRAPADDAPIIMAGGSLFIGNHPDFWFTQDSLNTKQLNYSAAMQVFEVDDSYYMNDSLVTDSTPVKAGTEGSVIFEYCKSAATCDPQMGQADTIILNWSPGNVITITTKLGKNHKLAMLLPYLRQHAHKQWVPRSVTFTGSAKSLKPLTCTMYDDNECTVIVHTCDPGQATCTNVVPSN